MKKIYLGAGVDKTSGVKSNFAILAKFGEWLVTKTCTGFSPSADCMLDR